MLSETLRTLRKSNGYTQKQIADILNIDRSTYSYYELGKINPSIGSMAVLSELYHLSIDEMVHMGQEGTSAKAASALQGYDTDSILSEDEKKLINYYRQLNTLAKEDVLISVMNIARDTGK